MAKNKRGKARSKQKARRKQGSNARSMVDVASGRLESPHLLCQAGRHEEGMAQYAEAIRQEPNNIRAYLMAARAEAQRFHFEGMEKQLQKLIRRAPLHPGIRHYVGETYAQLKLPARAIESYGKAMQLSGVLPETLVELASLYEGAHRLDEARELIERAMQKETGLPKMWLVRGRIQRRQKELEQAASTFRELIQRVHQSEWACQAWSELALMADREEDYEGAVEAIDRCKQLQLAHEDRFWKTSERIQSRLEQQVEEVTSDHLRRWREQASGFAEHRVALLTGFPRSGTTLLEQVLDAHPDLVSSEERDFVGQEVLRVFDAGQATRPLLDVLNDLSVQQIGPERDRYFQAMEYMLGEPISRQMHLDKNPGYLLSLPLVLRLFPETRLIVALRDPRDVVLSCYLRYLPFSAVSVRFLTLERTAQRYALEMRAWLKLRAMINNPWCEIRYEDTVHDLESQARKSLDMLGLAWDSQVLNYRDRLAKEKRVVSPTYEAVAEPIYTRAVGRWKNYEKLLEPVFETLAPFVKEFGYAE